MKREILLIAFVFASTAMFAQTKTLTNADIVSLVEIGLSDEAIIAKVKTSDAIFDTSVEELKTLKEKGISNNVIVTMINAKDKEEKESGEIIDENIGIYYKADQEYSKLYPSAFRGTASNTLGSAVTPFISNTKNKAILEGAQSGNVVNTNIPEFIFYFDRNTKHKSKSLDWCFSVASSPKEFVLVKMIERKDKRELKIGEIDIFSGKYIGVESKEVIQCTIEAMNETTFKVKPSTVMQSGEYCLFYQGSAPQTYQGNNPIFDFSISKNCKIENKFNVNQTIWIVKDSEPKKMEVMQVIVRNDGTYYSLRSRSSWKCEEYAESECYKNENEAVDSECTENYEGNEQPQ